MQGKMTQGLHCVRRCIDACFYLQILQNFQIAPSKEAFQSKSWSTESNMIALTLTVAVDFESS